MKILKNLCITMVFSLLITIWADNTLQNNAISATVVSSPNLQFSYVYPGTQDGNSSVTWWYFTTLENHPILDINNNLINLSTNIKTTSDSSGGTPIFPYDNGGGTFSYLLNSSDPTSYLLNQNKEKIITRGNILADPNLPINKIYNIMQINDAKNGRHSRIYAKDTAFMQALNRVDNHGNPAGYVDFVALNSLLSQVHVIIDNNDPSADTFYTNTTSSFTGFQSNRGFITPQSVIKPPSITNDSPIFSTIPQYPLYIWAPCKATNVSQSDLVDPSRTSNYDSSKPRRSDYSFYINEPIIAVPKGGIPLSKTSTALVFTTFAAAHDIYVEQYTLTLPF